MIPVRASNVRDRQINRKSQKLMPADLQKMKEAEPEQAKSARGGPGDHSEMLAFIESDNVTMAAETPKTQAQSNRNTVAMSL
jgi:hypothetical protein